MQLGPSNRARRSPKPGPPDRCPPAAPLAPPGWAPPPPASAPSPPPPPPAPATVLPLPSRDGLGVEPRHFRLLLGAGLALLVGVSALLLVVLLLYRWVDPPASTL